MTTYHADIPADILQRPPLQGQLLIDGRWCAAADGAIFTRRSPAHDHVVANYAFAGIIDTERAINAARRAFDEGPWPNMKGAERASLLHLVASEILVRKKSLALQEALETGKPYQQALAEIEGAADLWRYAATLARTLHGDSYNNLGAETLGLVLREPMGVVGIITPWNFPFLIVSQKLPFALAAGCTTVVKPSEFTSGTTLMLGEILLQVGLPDAVVNIVVGNGPVVGETLLTHRQVDMISFTGSTVVGKHAMMRCAQTLKRISTELGGKNPQIIFADCDMKAAVDATVLGMCFNAGQCCNSGSRVLVERRILQQFMDAVIRQAQQVVVGDPLATTTQIGAITTEKQFASILKRIEEAQQEGATIFLGGQPIVLSALTRGQFIAPTVIGAMKPHMSAAQQEIFGPVLSVLPFDTFDEAIDLANSTLYGLSAAVWSRNVDTCLHATRRIRAGTVWVNTFLEGHAELPFGGFRESGHGRELGRLAVEEFTERKTLHMHMGGRSQWYISSQS